MGLPEPAGAAAAVPRDLPIIDKPLPRFLDDAAAAKLLRATRADPDPLSRLIVELLARTGIRRGELLALTVDAVVQIGSAYWLRIPIGKLHNDRYIPLHPQLKELLDDWITHHRPTGLRTNRLLLEHNRPISQPPRHQSPAPRSPTPPASAHVTAHQLRHTLATQAVNRGMSLDAIAALLGHKTLAMTMIYARIADRTVADEYFAVTEKVEALYDQPRQLASDDEGPEMRKLRAEMHRRMLGNGYCARPVEMDCHFESICESCSFFVTTIEFRPTLQRQRDDAARKGQLGRQKIFDGILNRLDTDAILTRPLDRITHISPTSAVSCTGSARSHPRKPTPTTTLDSTPESTPVTRNRVCIKPGMLQSVATIGGCLRTGRRATCPGGALQPRIVTGGVGMWLRRSTIRRDRGAAVRGRHRCPGSRPVRCQGHRRTTTEAAALADRLASLRWDQDAGADPGRQSPAAEHPRTRNRQPGRRRAVQS